MARVQLAVNVPNLNEAITIHSELFVTEPEKVCPRYVNFTFENPPLKMVSIENACTSDLVNHLGVEHFFIEVVKPNTQRLSDCGTDTDIQPVTPCCYAVQNKAGVSTPNGAHWEIYTVVSDAETLSTGSDCCVSDEVQDATGTC